MPRPRSERRSTMSDKPTRDRGMQPLGAIIPASVTFPKSFESGAPRWTATAPRKRELSASSRRACQYCGQEVGTITNGQAWIWAACPCQDAACAEWEAGRDHLVAASDRQVADREFREAGMHLIEHL